MNILQKIYHRSRNKYYRIKRSNAIKDDFKKAKSQLLCSTDIRSEEKKIIETVSLQTHNTDTMYKDDAFHYLSVGLSAMRCIEKSLSHFPVEHKINTVLDFPCGHGRVLRFLCEVFPDSEITAAEIDNNLLDFCQNSFHVNTLLSKTNFGELSFPHRFDLIWCGSLLTHIDEQAASDLLQIFYNHLSDQGICIFTTHGQYSIHQIQSGEHTYGLTLDAQQKVIKDFQSRGYGYADYPTRTGYGLSVASYQRMIDLAYSVGKWRHVSFLERGWDNLQDVYTFAI